MNLKSEATNSNLLSVPLRVGSDFQHRESSRIMEIIKIPWNRMEQGSFYDLPIETIHQIGNYLTSEDKLLFQKVFKITYLWTIEELMIATLKEAMFALNFLNDATLMMPTTIFDPKPYLPPVEFYKELGEKMEQKIELFDSKIRLCIHLQSFLESPITKFKLETLTFNEKDFKLCLHCLVPIIMLEDIMIHTKLRRMQNAMTIDQPNVSSSVFVEYICMSCGDDLSVNALNRSHFTLYLQLPIMGLDDALVVKYNNFVFNGNSLSNSTSCFIQISRDEQSFKSYNSFKPIFMNLRNVLQNNV